MSFVNPEILYILLPFVIILGFFVLRKSEIKSYFMPDVLKRIVIKGDFIGSKNRAILLFISLILIVFALARPVLIDKNNIENQKSTQLFVLVDISLSMLSKDIYPDRLENAKVLLKRINTHLIKTDIGVVAFAKNAFIISPITFNKDNLDFLISNISSDLTSIGGSDIINALEKSIEFNSQIKEILIITDGGDFDKSKEILDIAKKHSLIINAITIGSQKGVNLELKDTLAKDKNGNLVTTKAYPWLEKVAIKTAGKHIEIPKNSDKFENFMDNIAKFDIKEIARNSNDLKELFYYPLGFAIFLLLFVFNSVFRFKNVLLVIVLLGFATDIKAFDILHQRKAKEFIQKGDFEKARIEFSKIDNLKARYNEANMLYKESKFENAINLYNEILAQNPKFSYEILHNLGNAYAKNRDFEKAKDSFERALSIKEDKDTRANLEIINAFIKELDDKKSPLDKLKEGSQMQLEDKKNGDLDGDPSKNKGIKKQNEKTEKNDEKKKNSMIENDKKKLLRELSRRAVQPLAIPLGKEEKKDNDENYW